MRVTWWCDGHPRRDGGVGPSRHIDRIARTLEPGPLTIPGAVRDDNYRRSRPGPRARVPQKGCDLAARNRPNDSDNTVALTRPYLSELGSYPLLTAERGRRSWGHRQCQCGWSAEC